MSEIKILSKSVSCVERTIIYEEDGVKKMISAPRSVKTFEELEASIKGQANAAKKATPVIPAAPKSEAKAQEQAKPAPQPVQPKVVQSAPSTAKTHATAPIKGAAKPDAKPVETTAKKEG